MTISGIGSRSALQVQNLVAMRRQLDDLQRQLGSGKKANDYAGVGLDRGLAIGLRGQLAATESFKASIEVIGTRLQLGQTALRDIEAAARVVKTALPKSAFVLEQNGRTTDQNTARGQLDRMLAALNAQFGDQYIFSGQSAERPAVASLDHILNGEGARAGFTQAMSERNQADLGASGLGRLVIPAATTTAATLVGTTAALSPDAAAVVSGSADLRAPYASAGGVIALNGVSVTVNSGDDDAGIRDAINAAMAGAPPGTVLLTASLDVGTGGLVLTGADARSAITVGAPPASTAALLTELGLSAGVTDPTNLLTQAGGLSAGQTLSVTIGTNPPSAVTFGTGLGEVATMAELNAALAGLAGGAASVNPANGNLTVAASSSTGAITIGGTAPPAKFGLAATTAAPTNIVSIGEDVAGSAFGFKASAVTTTIAGAAATGPSGAPPNLSIDIAAAVPKRGDTVTFTFALPDGSTEALALTAAVTAKTLAGAAGFTAGGGAVGGAPAPITIQAAGLNAGNPVTVSGILASDDAAAVASRITAALNALPTGTGGISVSVASGQLVVASANGDVVTMGGDGATLTAIGFAAGNRVSAQVSPASGENEFAIGATQADTVANLRAALTSAVGKLAQTSLAAASALAAANDFFNIDAANPPRRVNGPPFNTATSLVAGTAANTVTWYLGEAGASPARTAAVTRIDTAIAVSYGMRANEQGLRTPVANLAAFAAMTFSASDANAQDRYAALAQRLQVNLGAQSGVQKVSDIEADLAGAQVAMAAAKERHAQTTSALNDFLQSVEGVSLEQVGAQILAVQTGLQASLQTTALLAKLSLVNFL